MNHLATVFTLISAVCFVHADTQPRVLEISSRDLPLIGKVTFYAEDGSTVTGDWNIEGQRFAWHPIPESSAHFTLSSLSETSQQFKLFDTGNTFIPVNPTRPIQPGTLTEKGVPVRLPLVEQPRNYSLIEKGKTGKVFVGTLEKKNNESAWQTLYILKADTLKKPDANEDFRFATLDGLCKDSEIKPEYVANFPLKLRSAIEDDTPGVITAVLRAGQKLRFESVERVGKSVYAEVTVL